MFTLNDFLSTFGCSDFENEIRARINNALTEGKLPDFSGYNDPTNGKCACRTSVCIWTEKSILERLKERGIWDRVLDALPH